MNPHTSNTARKWTPLDLLKRKLPQEILFEDEDSLKNYSTDWTGLEGRPMAVALPRNTQEVQQVLKACFEEGIPVVPSGGRTGLSGGAVATVDCLVLSLNKLNKIHPVNTLSRTVRVGSGAITEAVHTYCEASGLTWPIDLASKGSSTIGGNLSTNAGGVRVVRYGMSRRWVVGIEAVTLSGEVLSLCEGLEKDNVGYNLMQLLLGSEGTLAVITEATLKLVPTVDEASRKVFLFSLGGLDALYPLFESARKKSFEVEAFEFFSSRCLEAVEKQMGLPGPFEKPAPYYALLEVECHDDKEQQEWLEDLIQNGKVLDGVFSTGYEQTQLLWRYRETITESLSKTSVLKKFDLSLPFSRQAEFLEQMLASVAKKGWHLDLYFFGHFGDGSPHINVLKPGNCTQDIFLKDFEAFKALLVQTILEFKGSMSAEHGVGLLRKEWLELRRTPAEKTIYRAIKKAFDPTGLLNPGKVIDL